MKNSKETRMCIGCRKRDCKSNMIRIAYVKDSGYEVDLLQRKQGRGAYICRNEDCLKRLMKNKRIKLNIDEEELRGVILGRE